jgi:hypothetical protein
MSHYDWLEEHLEPFLEAVGVHPNHGNNGLIGAHGDKCYGYKHLWEEAGIPFEHGVAIFLLSYVRPYGLEVRDTPDGFVKVDQWVVDNYDRFKEHLPPPAERLSDLSEEDLVERLWDRSEDYLIPAHAIEIMNAIDRGYPIGDDERRYLESLVDLTGG